MTAQLAQASGCLAESAQWEVLSNQSASVTPMKLNASSLRGYALRLSAAAALFATLSSVA